MTPRFLIYLSLLLSIVVYGVINIKKLSNPFKLLTLLSAFVLGVESMTLYGFFPITNPLILYHALLPVTMLLLWMIFRLLSVEKRTIDLIITIIFISLSLINSIWHQTNVFPSHGVSLLSNLGVWLSLQTLRNMISLPTNIDITKQARFWFSTVTLFFYTITFFAFTFFNFYNGVTWLQDLNSYAGLVLYAGYGLTLYFDINRNKYSHAT